MVIVRVCLRFWLRKYQPHSVIRQLCTWVKVTLCIVKLMGMVVTDIHLIVAKFGNQALSVMLYYGDVLGHAGLYSGTNTIHPCECLTVF